MQEKVLKLPARASLCTQKLSFDRPNLWGYDLKVVLRSACKRLPEYSIPVEIEPQVTGQSSTGVPIPINTLGRWVFGTPGYKGNCIFLGGQKNIAIQFPPEMPEKALEMIQKAVKNL